MSEVEKPLPASGGGCFLGCASVIAVLGILAIGSVIVSAGKSAYDENNDATNAQVLCEMKVKDSLKAPATASFSEEQSSSIEEDGVWSVIGSVDSENSFGANIRAAFSCSVEVRKSDGFTRTTLVSLG